MFCGWQADGLDSRSGIGASRVSDDQPGWNLRSRKASDIFAEIHRGYFCLFCTCDSECMDRIKVTLLRRMKYYITLKTGNGSADPMRASFVQHSEQCINLSWRRPSF